MRKTSCFSGLRPGLVALCLLCGIAVAVSACGGPSPSAILANPPKPYQEDREEELERLCRNDLDQVKQMAEKGDTQAQAALGRYYLDFPSTSENSEKAELWSTRAAEKGNPVAQFSLVYCYMEKHCALNKGLKSREEIEELQKKVALKWIPRAAQRGLARASYALGIMYSEDRWGIKDLKKAKEWLSVAAAQGDPRAQERLKELDR